MQAFGIREDVWRFLIARVGMPALLATPARAPDDGALPAAQMDERARAAFVRLLGAERVKDDRAARLAAIPSRLTALLRRRTGDLSEAPGLVLCPANEAELLAALKLCAEYDLGLGRAVALDLSGMNHILSCDGLSHIAEVEAGITGAELARQLAARGLTADLSSGDEPGGWIAAASRKGVIRSMRMATPQGLWTADAGMPARGPAGIMARVTLEARTTPALRRRCHWLVRDFSSGVALMRQAARAGVTSLALSDAAETSLLRLLADAPQGVRAWLMELYLKVRDIGDGACLLMADVERDADAKRLGALIARQNGMALKPETAKRWAAVSQLDSLAAALLDRGAAMDSLSVPASWSRLPDLNTAIRGALDTAMAAHAPRDGAKALVLARVSELSASGALLTVTWLYPRKLDDDVAQTSALHDAARQATHATSEETLNAAIFTAIRSAVDPKGVLS